MWDFIEKLKFWQNAYRTVEIRDGYLLKMAVKGGPFGIDLIIEIYIIYQAINSFILRYLSYGDWKLLMVNIFFTIVFMKIAFDLFKLPITYVCCLYNDAILISAFGIKSPAIIEIPFSDILAINGKADRDPTIKTTYQTTFGLQLFKYRLVYILCEYKGMKHYYKIRVNDEIYHELNKRFP